MTLVFYKRLLSPNNLIKIVSQVSGKGCCPTILAKPPSHVKNNHHSTFRHHDRKQMEVLATVQNRCIYETVADVPESWLWWRADFQSGSRVLKRCSEPFLSISLAYNAMWFHAEKLLKTLKFWKSLTSLYKSGSRPQKSRKIPKKTLHSIAICSFFSQ